jgi:cytochrome bd-type quinol oxidase subunit 1
VPGHGWIGHAPPWRAPTHHDIAKASIKIALGLAVFASVLQLVTGHSSAIGI